jgi:hypothetical protein
MMAAPIAFKHHRCVQEASRPVSKKAETNWAEQSNAKITSCDCFVQYAILIRNAEAPRSEPERWTYRSRALLEPPRWGKYGEVAAGAGSSKCGGGPKETVPKKSSPMTMIRLLNRYFPLFELLDFWLTYHAICFLSDFVDEKLNHG